jgi:hypothetical protein
VVDDFVKELNLIGGPGFAGQEAGQRFFGGRAFQADEGADEEAEALFTGGGLDFFGTPWDAPFNSTSRPAPSGWPVWRRSAPGKAW